MTSKEVGNLLPPSPITERKEKSNLSNPQEFARQQLVETLTRMGYSIDSFEEAWGQLVAIQGEIAADPDNGSKATSAIKFVAEATGVSIKPSSNEADNNPLFPNLSLEDAEKLLLWLKNSIKENYTEPTSKT